MALDWTQIQDEKVFQRLINDLFAIEVGKPGFYASSPFIGADGGWDGMFNFPYNGYTGLTSVQSKHTTQNHAGAKAFLKRGLIGTKTEKGELEKSKDNSVDNLYYCTNAELKVTDITELLALNARQVKNLVIYHRENLRPLIEKSPWIRHKYFNQPLAPLFIPVTEYQKLEESLLIDFPLLERETLIADVLNFLSDGNQRIFELIAPQGNGKSLFLVKIAEIIQDKTDWTVFFFTPAMALSQDSIQEISDNNKKYILIVDNADMEPESFEDLLRSVKNMTEKNKKILFTVRTPTKDKIEGIISQKRITPTVKTLPTLSKDSLIKLFEQSAQGVVLPHPERVVKDMANNPQAIVDYGRLLSKKIKTDEFKQSILNIVNNYIESEKYTSLISKDNLKSLILHLAILVPVKNEDLEEIKKQTCKEFNITPDQFDSLISTLVDAKVLRKINSAIRFSPDLCGILVISSVIEEDSFFLNGTISKYMDHDPEKVIENLYLAIGHVKNEYLPQPVIDKINDLIYSKNQISQNEKKKVLEWLAPASRMVPEQVLNLLSVLLKSDNESVDSDHYGPAFLGLFETIGHSNQIIDLMLIFASKVKKGTYDNYSISSLSSKLVSPLDRNFNEVINRLQIISEMIPTSFDSSLESIEVIISSVREALLGSHQYSESYGYTLTIGRKSLVYSPKLIEYRGAAMLCLERLIKHSNQNVRAKSIDIIEQIGSESNGPKGELWSRILAEKNNSLDWLAEIIPASSFSVLAEIEDVAIHLWANNDNYPELEQKAVDILDQIPRIAEYNLFKILSNNQHLVIDFNEVKDNAPKSDRWSWLVHTYFRGLSDKEKNYLPDTIKEISQKYKTPKEILGFLGLLDSEIKKDHWSYIPVVESWYEVNPDPFIELANEDIDTIIPKRFRLGLHLSTQKNNAEYLQNYIDEISKTEVIPFEKTNYVLQMIRLNKIDLMQKIEWYLVLINHFDSSDARLFISNYWGLFEGAFTQEEQEKIILPISMILEKDLLGDQLSDLEHSLHFLIKNGILSNEPLKKLETQIYAKLVVIKSIDDNGELLRIACGNSLLNLLDFFERRAVYSKEKNVYFSIIPYHGLNFLDDMVQNYQDFKLLFSKLYSLTEKDLLSRFDIEHITKNIHNKGDASGKYYDQYISELLTGGKEETKQLIALSNTFGFSKESVDLFIAVFELAEKYDLFDSAYDSFANAVFSYSWSGAIGQAPTAMINRRDALVEMKDKLKAGRLKTLVEGAVKRFTENIEKHEAEDEE